MNRIYKYTLGHAADADIFEIGLPIDNKILHFGMQNKIICFWALVDVGIVTTVRKFKVVGTGHDIDQEFSDVKHLATVFDGPFVWHILEV